MKKILLAIVLVLITLGTSSAGPKYLTCDVYEDSDNITSFPVIANGTSLTVIAIKDTAIPVGLYDKPTVGKKLLWVDVTTYWVNGINSFTVSACNKWGCSSTVTLTVNATLPQPPSCRIIAK